MKTVTSRHTTLAFLMLVTGCSTIPDDLYGKYNLSGSDKVVATLEITEPDIYTFCNIKCESGTFRITFQEGTTGRIVFTGEALESLSRELYADIVGEDLVDQAGGRPKGSIETTFEVGPFGASIAMEGTRDINFKK